MANRCPDCNKFVSLEPGEGPEISVEVDESGDISGTATVYLCCAECGTEILTATVDLEGVHEGEKTADSAFESAQDIDTEDEMMEEGGVVKGKRTFTITADALVTIRRKITGTCTISDFEEC